MRDTIRLGRVAGIRVGLNWSLLVMVALVAVALSNGRFALELLGYSSVAYGYTSGAYAVAGIATAVGLLLGVLLHELAHALVARRVGLTVDGITLSWMGGVTRIQGDASRPRDELVVAGVGPLTSAAFGGVLWLLRLVFEAGGAGALVVAALGWLALINLLLAVFNMLPAAPLDGGRVLHAAIWGVSGDRWRASRASSTAGVVLGAVVVAAGFIVTVRSGNLPQGLLIGIIGWWILGSARIEATSAQIHHALDGVRVGDIMRPVGAAPGWITVRAFADSYAASRPGWVWLLSNWNNEGYDGVLLGDSLASVPFPQWDLVRPVDVALPISATTGASPEEGALTVLARLSDKKVILVVDGGRTVGSVLPSDVEALVRMGGKGPVPSRGWSLIHQK
jgi:Zn-dependent protease